MLKPYLLILCLFALSFRLSAQKNGYLSLSAGPAIPAGEFANGDPYSEKSGLALPGGLIDLTYQHDIPRSPVGYLVSLRARMNPIDQARSKSLFEQQFPDYTWSIKTHSWESMSLMVGLFERRNISGRVYMEGGFMMGIASCVLPESTITGVKDTGANHITTDLAEAHTARRTATTFSMGMTAGGGYHLHGNLYLVAHLSFMYMEPQFRNMEQTVTELQGFIVPGNTSPSNAQSAAITTIRQDYSQSMNSFDLTVGLSWRL